MRTGRESLKKGKIIYFQPVKNIFNYVILFVRESDKRLMYAVTLFTGLLVFFNYRYGMDPQIRKNPFPVKLIAWYGVSATAFIIPYLFGLATGSIKKPVPSRYVLLLLLAPLIFALKLSLNFQLKFSSDPAYNYYWNQVAYWPLLGLITGALLFLIWRKLDRDQPFYGFNTRGVSWKPYWLMLLVMLPLVALASLQPDFRAAYPKLNSITDIPGNEDISTWHHLLFELSYGSDFVTIELFFRGFLVLAFIKWAGREAILPMACFYCTIHFGKPLAECISSYFGGIILGIVAYHTRSILGGLMVHLGVAWMMEWAGQYPLSP